MERPTPKRGLLSPHPVAPMPAETDQVATQIIDAAYAVHRALGPGLLESVYEICLTHELSRRGLSLLRQVDVPIVYRDVRLDAGVRLDLVVEDRVVVELKAVEVLLPLHTAQLLTYPKLSGKRLGLLINLNVASEGVRRVAL